jgi:hypothetical protein
MQAVSVTKRTTTPTEKVAYSSLLSLSSDAVPYGSSFREAPTRRTVSPLPTSGGADALIQDHLDRQRKFARLVMAGQYTAALSESMAPPQHFSALASLLLSEEATSLSPTAHYVLHCQLLEWQQSNQWARHCLQQESGMEPSEHDRPLLTRAITPRNDATKQ